MYAHIYMAIRRTANHPYTKVSDPGSPRVTGSQGHGSPEPQSHKATDPQSHGDARSQGHGVTLSHYHMVTWSLGHWVTGSLGYLSHAFISMAQVSRVSMVTQVLGSHDHWVAR